MHGFWKWYFQVEGSDICGEKVCSEPRLEIAGWNSVGDDFIGAAYDYVGTAASMSSDGTVVAIGSGIRDGVPIGSSGYVRVYRWDETEGEWGQLGDTLRPDRGHPKDAFGMCLDLSGDGNVIAVGGGQVDIDDDDNVTAGPGYVRVYELVDGSWMPKGDDINGANPGDMENQVVSLSGVGTTLAIGMPNAGITGQVQTRRWSVKNGIGSWREDDSQATSFYPRDHWLRRGQPFSVDEGGEYGGAVALSPDGAWLAVGARRQRNTTNGGGGRVYVYRDTRAGDAGAGLQGEHRWGPYVPIDGAAGVEEFGSSLAFSGGRFDTDYYRVFAPYLAIGSPTGGGRVDVFSTSPLGRSVGNAIVGSDIEGLGFSVDISGFGRVLIAGTGSTGRARVFALSGDNTTWTQDGEDIKGYGNGDGTGHTVDISADGNTLLVGSADYSHCTTGSGRISILERDTD